LEAWQKVFLKKADFMQDTHGQVGCVICHGGDSRAETKETAHLGMVRNLSATSCTSCHQDITVANESSMHSTLAGMQSSLEMRGGDFSEGSTLSEAFQNHCSSCHTTCGQCHISRPANLEGGLISSHKIKRPPSMTNTCVACHGARAGAEYLGQHEGIPGDLHWTKQGMTCSKCHGEEMHGTPDDAANRYQNDTTPQCEDCHAEVLADPGSNLQHAEHLDDLACQVCHAVAYKNCYGCHVEMVDGKSHFSTEPSTVEFKIGLNPLVSAERPYQYVVVRHVPVSVDTFGSYGDDLLPGFDTLPTWKLATPHNIQLKTPQNESCNACHGNKDLFLTEDNVAPSEREANKTVIVIRIPAIR